MGQVVANVVVFDVGGTKVATTVVNEQGEDLLDGHPRRFETPESAPAEVFVDAMTDELETLRKEFGDVVAWGAAFPGPFERLNNGELLVLPKNIPGMRGR